MPANAGSEGVDVRSQTLQRRATGFRATVALATGQTRYWKTLAPLVRDQLRGYREQAEEIDDPELRRLAVQKLEHESFHAEAAAMLATRVPASQRKNVVETIVALEVLFDYLDGLTERDTPDGLIGRERLYEAYVDVFRAGRRTRREDRGIRENDVYVQTLSEHAGRALERLPSARTIMKLAEQSAIRSAQAQSRIHSVATLGRHQLEEWASEQAHGTGLSWQEFLASTASSVLAIHALVAAAAQPNLTEQAASEILDAYSATCVLLTLLDGTVDHAKDLTANNPAEVSYTDLYDDRTTLTQNVRDAALRASSLTTALPDGSHHLMLTLGVAAYYCSAPGARTEFARPIVNAASEALSPMIYPALGVMHAWRARKRVAERKRPQLYGLPVAIGLRNRDRRCNEL